MATRNGRSPPKDGLAPGRVPGRGLVSDALKEEAERGWAESDRKAAKGRRRTQTRVGQRGKARKPDGRSGA